MEPVTVVGSLFLALVGTFLAMVMFFWNARLSSVATRNIGAMIFFALFGLLMAFSS